MKDALVILAGFVVAPFAILAVLSFAIVMLIAWVCGIPVTLTRGTDKVVVRWFKRVE